MMHDYKLGRLDKVLVLIYALSPVNPDTESKMVCGRTIKMAATLALHPLGGMPSLAFYLPHSSSTKFAWAFENHKKEPLT